MRSFVVTGCISLALGVGALLAGWALQALALSPPSVGEVAAVRAMTILRRYRFVESDIHLRGLPPAHGRCLRGWFTSATGKPARGVRLSLGRGATIFDFGRHGLTDTGPMSPRQRADRVADLLLGGCPSVLSSRVDGLLQGAAPARERHVWLGRPALRIGLALPHGTIALYLAPKTDETLGIAVRFPHVRGWSRIRPIPFVRP